MPGHTAEDLLALFDRAPLNLRYWVTFALMAGIAILDFFDFLVIGYVLAVIGPRWQLTYGESALILYSGGIGAIIGALAFGSLSDAWGRKPPIIIGTFICGISAALIGVVPHGAWWLFAVLRFFVGVGLTAATAPALTVVVELTPTRHRTRLTGFYQLGSSSGGLLASLTSATLLAALGWRGVAMLGIMPALLGILVWFLVPESARWLTAKGRFAEARATVAKHLRMPIQSVPVPSTPPATVPRGNLRDLYSQPQRFWETLIIWGASATAGYGIYLWGPTIVAMVLIVPVPQAAKYFVFVALGGITGKVVASFLAPVMGRRPLGAVWGFGSVVALAGAGYFHAVLVGPVPLMVILLCCSTFFVEGGFANLPPYTVERYGVRLGARSAGLGQAGNGIGKILGPMSLALIAGTSNIVNPHATAEAVLPAYLFLAGCMVLVGLSFVILGVETHGRAMALGTEDATPRPVIPGTQAR
jgi:MFS transporter, putative metabolite:H+ symporter